MSETDGFGGSADLGSGGPDWGTTRYRDCVDTMGPNPCHRLALDFKNWGVGLDYTVLTERYGDKTPCQGT